MINYQRIYTFRQKKMIKSMTGFGVGTISTGSDKYNIEIRSVNARFLDIKFKGIQLDLPS